MKKLFLIFIFMLAFMAFPSQSRADNNSSLSEDTIEDIVDKVLELDEAGKTKAEIVDAVQDLLDTDSDDDSDEDEDEDEDDEDGDDEDDNKPNKGKSSIKKINFGQTKKLLKKGDNSEEVKDLQEALNKLADDLGFKFTVLIVDGKYGPATVQLVKMLQAYQQVTADGAVGPITLAKLNALLEKLADNTAPVITLVGDATVNVALNGTYTEQGATATDAEDGTLTSSIVTTGTVNTAVAGSYTVNYNVTDSDGVAAVQVSRTVVVQ